MFDAPVAKYSVVKRLIDVFAAGILLIILSPVMLIVASAIRLDSPGPVFFRQRRMGRGNKEFVLIKFRTMHWGTPDLPTDEMARRGLSPVTRVGAWLRRYSLDEVPQLINVVKGEMSLVGPRPALPTQFSLNAQRSLVGVDDLLPGITGWAQVNGRDDLSDTDKVACDAYYRNHRSLRLDVEILMRTAGAVFTGRGNR